MTLAIPLRRRSWNERRLLPLCFVLVLSCGCKSTDSTARDGVGTPYVPPAPLPDDSIGYFLAQIDKSLQHWSELKLGSRGPRQDLTLQALEESLRRRSVERQDELVRELEAGPPTNREIAAVALGFTGDPAVLSPLLAALLDPDPGVAQKAVLGLGILALPETPLSEIAGLLSRDPDAWTRNNAAFALHRIVSAGGRLEGLELTLEEALLDSEPGVRAQAASTLGLLGTPDAIQSLGALLTDSTSLVAAAAASSVVSIGRLHPEKKGEAARVLADALDRVSSSQRTLLVRELSRLSGKDLGPDTAPWREWAYRMP